MLCRTILTLLIASISISRIQAKEIGERSAQLNKTRVDGVNIVIEASTIQKDNTFNTGPNDESIYGSIVKVKNNEYESPDSRKPISTQTRTVIAPGGPGHDGVSYVKSEERDHQGQPEIGLKSRTYMSGNTFQLAPGTKHVFGSYIELNNNVNSSRGGNNQTQPNEKDRSSNGPNIGLTADTILINNVFQTSGNMKIYAGSSIIYNGVEYIPPKNSQTEKPDDFTNLMNEFLHLIQKEDRERKKLEDETFPPIKDPSKGQLFSAYVPDDSSPSSQVETNAQDNKEKEAHAKKHSESPQFCPFPRPRNSMCNIFVQGIQAKEIGERSAQLNKTRVDGVNSVIEASTIQKDNTFNTGPNDESIYGSIVKVKNNEYESPDSRKPISTQTRTVIAPGILTNNVFQTSGNMKISAGSSITYNDVEYIPPKNSQTEKPDDLTNVMNDFQHFIQKEDRERKKLEDETFPQIKDPSKGQLFSAYVPDDSSPSSQVETNAQDNKEKEAHAKKHSEPNGQTSLSPNVFFLLTYFLITLIKLNVLN